MDKNNTGKNEKIVLVTGANSGIGKELVIQYAKQNATVILACRSVESGEEVVKKIRQTNPQAKLHVYPLDLSSFASVTNFSQAVKKDFKTIDVLMLNAGIHIPHKTVLTSDKIETQYQVNFLSNFLLVELLLTQVINSTDKKIVYITSNAHKMARFKQYPFLGFWMQYAVSKQAATAWMYMLQTLRPELQTYIIAPKRVGTNVHRYKSKLIQRLNNLTTKYQEAAIAAKKIISIVEGEKSTAAYWYDGEQGRPSNIVMDKDYQTEIWNDAVKTLDKHISQKKLVSNFARNFSGVSTHTYQPTTTEELRKLIEDAKKEGKKIHIFGKKHSYNDIFFTTDLAVSLEKFPKKIVINNDKQTVTCGPSVTIRELCNFLDNHGYTLPFGGAYGEQTVVGALCTGTHGFYRHGGVLSELVIGIKILDSNGKLHTIDKEPELEAFRLSLGVLGIITEVILTVKEKSLLCTYTVQTMQPKQFEQQLPKLFKDNEYLRFFLNPLTDEILYFTINTFPKTTSVQTDTVHFFADQTEPNKRLIQTSRKLLHRKLLMQAISFLLMKIKRFRNFNIRITTEFSSFLFINEGITTRMPKIARFINSVINDNRDHCMEFAIPLTELSQFLIIFEKTKEAFGFSRKNMHVRLSARTTGANTKALLAPNYGRDIIFMDVFVKKNEPNAEAFLQTLEQEILSECNTRFHWGKMFYSTHETINKLYPAENISHFKEIKKKYDPDGLFSNQYSKRVLNI